jgi:hypothetical protein
VAEPHAAATESAGQVNHVTDFFAILRREHHVERERQAFEEAQSGRAHDLAKRACATELVMCPLARSVQAEGHTAKEVAALKQEGINGLKVPSVRDEAEAITLFTDAPDNCGKLTMERRFTAVETHMINPAVNGVPQHHLQNGERQIAGARVSLRKAVQATQIAPICQLENDPSHWRYSNCR